MSRYTSATETDRQEMLDAIGVESIDDLFAPIPAEYRLKRDLNVPRQMAESEILDFFQQSSRDNAAGYATFAFCFAGADVPESTASSMASASAPRPVATSAAASPTW